MMSFLRRANAQRGFTLIELIVAMTVLAIIIAPTLGLFSAALKNNRYEKEKLLAVAIAQGEIEELKAKAYQELLAVIGEAAKELIVEDGTRYMLHTKVVQPEPKLLSITVTVSWTGGKVSFSTAKGDL